MEVVKIAEAFVASFLLPVGLSNYFRVLSSEHRFMPTKAQSDLNNSVLLKSGVALALGGACVYALFT